MRKYTTLWNGTRTTINSQHHHIQDINQERWKKKKRNYHVLGYLDKNTHKTQVNMLQKGLKWI